MTTLYYSVVKKSHQTLQSVMFDVKTIFIKFISYKGGLKSIWSYLVVLLTRKIKSKFYTSKSEKNSELIVILQIMPVFKKLLWLM